jgi:hypothetical protein
MPSDWYCINTGDSTMTRLTWSNIYRGTFKQGTLIACALFATLAISPMVTAIEADESSVKKSDRQAKPTLAAAEGLPKPDALYAKYVEAIGGEEALRGHTSYRVSGAWSMPAMGMEGRFRITAAAPSYYLLVLNAPGMGEIRSGYDGKVGWMDGDLTGASLLEERELAQTKVDADFYYPLNFSKHYTELKTIEIKEFAGKACYRVRGTRRTGDQVSHYFDRETGLLLGSTGVRSSEFGDINTTIIHSEFQEVDGIKIPHMMKMNMPDMAIEQHFRTTEMVFGDVDKSVFAIPDAIQRLLDRKKQAEPAEADEAEAAPADSE